MIAQAYSIARFLQCEILLAPEYVQGADRSIEIFASEQECAHCPIDAVDIELFIKLPSAIDE